MFRGLRRCVLQSWAYPLMESSSWNCLFEVKLLDFSWEFSLDSVYGFFLFFPFFKSFFCLKKKRKFSWEDDIWLLPGWGQRKSNSGTTRGGGKTPRDTSSPARRKDAAQDFPILVCNFKNLSLYDDILCFCVRTLTCITILCSAAGLNGWHFSFAPETWG